MNLGNRNSQHSFAQIPDVRTARSKFNRSFATKDTFDFDYLIPIFVDEILPGDTCNLNVKSFCRLATQTVPILDNMYVDYFFFFVPNRLVWDNWEKFNGQQDDPGDSTDYLIPVLSDNTTGGFDNGSIFDHFGIPPEVDNLSDINALPFRAYNLIWNEWFRDQNLQDRVTLSKGDGPDTWQDYDLLKRAKKHDYFTSCLPWPQKGDAVTLGITGELPVYGQSLGWDTVDSHYINRQLWQSVDNQLGGTVRNGPASINADASTPNRTIYGNLADSSTDATGFGIADKSQYDTAIAGATYSDEFAPAYALADGNIIATINDIRLSMMTQSLLELDARGGTRYTEIIRAHFNVISPDQRLQRPEFLSGGSTQIHQHPVAQTSESGTTPQGNLAAFSTSAVMDNKIGFNKSFTEHGYVIGLAQARGENTYQQGLNKMWSRQTRLDFFWPKLQELGEQAVLNKEIYLQGTTADDDVFGYQERYAEYRFRPSEIKGQFRSEYASSLDVWHLAEEFSTLPSLNDTFIQQNTPIERALATGASYPHMLADFYFQYNHVRPMMTYGVPATLGRF